MSFNPRFTRLASTLLLVFAAALPFGQNAFAQTATTLTPAERDAQRAALLKMSADGLQALYKVSPEARAAIEAAPGYAVFDITSIYAIFLVGQKGKGVLFDNTTKKQTFMQSARAGTGPGVGKQRVFQIFVFKVKGAMDQFVFAGGLGGDVGASVSTGTGGFVRSFNPEIDIYQIPESGFAMQASWGGTVYSVDGALN